MTPFDSTNYTQEEIALLISAFKQDHRKSTYSADLTYDDLSEYGPQFSDLSPEYIYPFGQEDLWPQDKSDLKTSCENDLSSCLVDFAHDYEMNVGDCQADPVGWVLRAIAKRPPFQELLRALHENNPPTKAHKYQALAMMFEAEIARTVAMYSEYAEEEDCPGDEIA